MLEDENKGISDGADISGMFKNIGINPPREIRVEQPSYAETPKVVQWTMKYSGGLIKNKNQAQYALLGFVVVAIIVSLFLFFGGGGKQTTPPPESYIEKPQFLPNR